MRNFKKLPDMAGISPQGGSLNPDMPYNVMGTDGDGYNIAQLPYSTDEEHGVPWTTSPSLIRAGRT